MNMHCINHQYKVAKQQRRKHLTVVGEDQKPELSFYAPEDFEDNQGGDANVSEMETR